MHPKSTGSNKYVDSLLPQAPLITMFYYIAGLMVFIVLIEKLTSPAAKPLFIAGAFLIFFLAPIIYNSMTSPFEQGRRIIKEHSCGGRLWLLFHASYPFFKLIVYEDALEVRVFFTRYLIPYDSLGPLPRKVGFFDMGIHLTSALPGVPQDIKLNTVGMASVLKTINEARDKALGRQQISDSDWIS